MGATSQGPDLIQEPEKMSLAKATVVSTVKPTVAASRKSRNIWAGTGVVGCMNKGT